MLTSPIRPSLLRRLRTRAALGTTLAGLALGLAPAADAALTLEKDAPARVLLGNASTVTLRATNASPGPQGYNLTFRDVLPAGVSYVAGSAAFRGEAIEPRVIANAPGPGQTTLIFDNVADISVGGTQSMTYRVDHSTSGGGAFGIGDTYTNEATALANTEPRVVPRFNADGTPIPSPTGMTSAPDQATTQVNAIRIEKSEPSPEGEILRGTHDHQTVYTLTVTNNGVHPTTGITVEDFLPAGLEFLGCGTDDNTTWSPTALGTDREYPGAGPINPGNAPAAPDCVEPTTVTTVETDPDGAGPLPLGVYTHVVWEDVGALAADEDIRIQYVAAVPMRENTMDWATETATTGGTTPATDGAQTANLGNNSGPETTDEQELTNYAVAAGTYRGDAADTSLHQPVSDETTLTRTAEDLAVIKSVVPDEIEQAGISEWTLDFRTSEYRQATDLVATDTLPNGLCPLGSANYESASGPVNPECDPVSGETPSPNYTSVTENADGTWTLVWNLPAMGASDTAQVTFPTRTRRFYQENYADDADEPVRAGDSWTNEVDVTGNAPQICVGDATCDPSGPGATPIDPGSPASRAIEDDSAASQTSGDIAIDKTVLDPSAIGDPVPVECGPAQTTDPDAFVDAPTVPTYGPGDRICWRLRVDFSSSVDTGEPRIRDFIPDGLTYEPGSAAPTSRNTIGGLTVDDTAAADDGVLSWSLTDVPTGSEVFEWTFATIVDADAVPADDPSLITGNLMKLSYRNTGGQTFSRRDRVEAQIAKPVVDLVKDVTAVSPAGGATITGGNATNVPVGSQVTYRVRLTNTGDEDAVRTEVWDDLPAGITCDDVDLTALALAGGSCADPLGVGRITWTGVTVPADGTTDLTYVVTVPSGLPPQTALTNEAGVVEYQRDTNRGGAETFVPRGNIDATREPEANAPEADDPATITLRDVGVGKSIVSTSVDDAANGNDLLTQATIGETITYEVAIRVPNGTTLYGTPTLTDAVNARMDLLATPAPTVTQAGGTPVALPTPSVTDNQLSLAFPGPYANTATTDAVFTVRFTTRVRDDTTPVDANRRGQTLANSAGFTWQPSATDPATTTRTGTAPNVTIVEPNLVTSKVAALTSNLSYQTSTVSAGDGVRYTVSVRNRLDAGVASSHETLAVDAVPLGITPRKTDGTPVTATGDEVGVIGFPIGVWNATDRTITWSTIGTLAPEAFTRLIYEADVDAPAPAGAVYTNSVTATGTSLLGSDPNERTSTSSYDTGYISTSTRSLTVEGGELTKTAASPRATVGDLIDYTVEYTLPPNVAFNDLTFVDALPDGVAYVAGSAQVTCVDPADETGPACALPANATSPVARTAPRNPATGVEPIAWLLDDIGPATDPRTVRLTYQGRITSSYAAIGATAPVSAGDVLTNSVTALFNATDAGPPPTGFPDPSDYDDVAGPETADVTVREPRITLDKHVSGIPSGDDVDRRDTQPGDDYTYTLTVTNEGDSPAYDVQVADALSAKLTNVVVGTPPPGTTVTDGDASDGTLGWTIAEIAPGADVTLTYTADLAPSAQLTANETVVNTATVPAYWNAGETERDAAPDDTFREYTTNPPTDTVTLDVRLPNLTVQKTTGVTDGSGGFLDAANAEIGESFPWRIVITNPSPSSVVEDVSVVDVLPAGWTFDPGSAAFASAPARPDTFPTAPTIVTDDDGDRLTWATIGDIAPGGQVVLTFTATPGLETRLEGNPQVNAVQVTGDDSDGQPGSADGPYADDDTAGGVLQLPELEVSKTPDGGAAVAGDDVSYSIVVRNVSTTAPARDVELTDTLEAFQAYVPGSATATPSTGFSEVAPVVAPGDPEDPADDTTTIGWRIAEIPAGGQVTITVPVTLDADLAEGTTVRNGVSVVSREITEPVTDDGTLITSVDADVGVVKTITAPTGPVVPGQTVTYQVVATNHGPSVATGVVVTDELPSTLTLETSPDECAVSRQELACSVGTLGVGDTATFAFTATIDAAATGTLSNTASVTSTTPDSNPDNDSSTATVGLSPQADLVVAKTTSTGSVHQGDEFSYEITVRNAGPSDAVAVTLNDPLPAPNVVLASTAPTTDVGTCTSIVNTVNCTIGTLAPDQTATITVHARAVNVGTFDNTATAATTTPESSFLNNASTDDIEVEPVANVGIEKTAPATVAANGTLTYALRLSNAGPSPATNVVVEDDLPDGVTFVSASPGCTHAAGTVTCTRATLPVSGDPADDPTYEITVQVPWALADATLSNTATIEADEEDRTPSDDGSTTTTTVGPAVNLRTVKAAPTLPVPQTVPFAYRVTVTNDGPSTAVAATLSDPMPAGVTALDADSDVGTCTVTATQVDCAFGDLARDATATVTITARGDLPGTFTNVATAASTTPEIDPDDHADGADVEILAAADVGVVKTAPAQVDGDRPLSYGLEITNHGPSDATGVTVTDALPDGVVFVSADAGCTLAGRTVTCAIDDLDAGDAVTREIVVHVPFALGGQTVTNIASVTVDQVDLNPDNDSSTTSTIVGDVADLAVVKTAGGAVAGGQATWTVTVANRGPNAAQDVRLRDVLPPGTGYRSAQPSAGSCTGSGREIDCALGTLAAGGSVQIAIVADVAGHIAGQQLRNTATASSATPDGDPTNDTDTADVVVAPAPPTSPDLRVTKVASTTRPQLGRPLTYRIEVANVGDVAAQAVRLTDTMNRDARVTRARAAQGTCAIDDTTVTCELGAIAPGQTVVVTVRVTPRSVGALRNTVSVQAAGQAETRLDDNEAVANVRVGTTRTTVALRKRASRRTVRGGNRVTFTITAKMGKHAGSNVRVCDRLPRGLTFVRATGARFSRGQACWTVPFMAPRQTRTFRIVARTERSDATRTIRNTAVVRARNVKRRTASATVRVTPALAARAGGVTG